MSTATKVRLPGLPRVSSGNAALDKWIQAVNERMEAGEGARGASLDRVVTVRDLQNFKPTVSGVVLSSTLSDQIYNSQAYKELASRLKDASVHVDISEPLKRLELAITKFNSDLHKTEVKFMSALNERMGEVARPDLSPLDRRITQEAKNRNSEITQEAYLRTNQIMIESDARVDAVTKESIARIDQVQQNAYAMLDYIITTDADRLNAAAAVANARTELNQTIVDGLSAEASQRTILEAKFTTDVGTATLAVIASEASARTTAIAAEATQRELLATEFLGADGTALTSGLIYDERTARATAENALAQQITLLSAGSGEQFDWQAIWYFDAGVESWTGNGTPAASAGFLRPANQSSGAYVDSPVGMATDGAKYGQVRLRSRKTGSPTWAGYLWWRTSSDSTWDAARRVALTEPTWDVHGIGLVTATPAWTGTIDHIRIDMSSAQTVSDYFELDWVAVGRPSPGASAAQLLVEQTARTSADSALTTSISTLSAQVNNATTGLPATLALLTTEQTTRANADTAEASARTTLASRVTTTEGNIVTLGSNLTTEQTTRADADSTNAANIVILSSQVNNATTGLPATRSDLVATQTTFADEKTSNARQFTALKSQSKEMDIATLTSILNGETAKTNWNGELALARQELNTDIVVGLSAEASARTVLAAVVNANAATLTAEQLTIATGAMAESSSITTLEAHVADNTAALIQEASTRADQDSATSSQSVALAATTGSNAAAITVEQTARTDSTSALSSQITSLAAATGENAASISVEQTARSDATSALSLQITTLAAATGDNAASITVEQLTRTDATSALSAQVVKLGAVTGSNAAALVVEQTVRTDAASALSSQITFLGATTGDNKAGLLIEQTARTDAQSALSSQVTTLLASTGENLAALTVEQTTRTDATSALSSQVTTLAAATGDNIAGLSVEQTTRTDATSALSSQVTTLAASTGANSAALIVEQTTRSDAEGALSSQVTTLAAKTGSSAAALTVEQEARATAESAISSQVTSLGAVVGNNSAGLIAEQSARADATSALSSQLISLTSVVGDTQASVTSIEQSKIGYATLNSTGEVFDNSGAIKTADNVTTYNTANPTALATWHIGLPLASAVKQVRISDGTDTMTLEQRMTAQKTTNGDLRGQYSIKIDAGGRVAGFGLSSTSPVAGPGTSDFIVLADNFSICPANTFSEPVAPSAGAIGQTWYNSTNGLHYRATATGSGSWVLYAPKVPFSVNTLTDTIHINSDVKIDGSVAASQITAGTITAAVSFNTDGYIVADGSYTHGLWTTAGLFNASKTSYTGVIGYAGNSESGLEYGLLGFAADGIYPSVGVSGVASTALGVGVKAVASFGGTALQVVGPSSFDTTITSSVLTGTKPLTIESATKCDNLNADMLDGKHAAYFAKYGETVQYYGGGNGTLNIASTTDVLLIEGPVTSLVINMPASPIHGQSIEISIWQASSGIDHQAYGSGLYISHPLPASPATGCGGKWRFFEHDLLVGWWRVDGA